MIVDLAAVPDLHVVGELAPPSPAALRADWPCAPDVAAHVAAARVQVRNVVTGADQRLLVVVGPCSIHDRDAGLEYARWLAGTAVRWRDALLVVMRVYLEKPRTRGGWPGLLYDPLLDGSGRLDRGLVLGRQLLLEVNRLGLPVATEYVSPVSPRYVGDLVSWAAVGARTTESPLHRQLASALPCPVGFKNTTSGDVLAAVNAILTARQRQRLQTVDGHGRLALLTTAGNPDGHVVLRGGGGTNYDPAAIARAGDLLAAAGLPRRLMVDCGHGNCGGDYRRQRVVAEAVADYVRAGGDDVLGVMIESALVEGAQPLGPPSSLVYGQSVTDGCLGLEDTAAALDRLAAAVRAGRPQASAVARG